VPANHEVDGGYLLGYEQASAEPNTTIAIQ
jgi:hypothetical protein